MIARHGQPVAHKFSETERDHAGKINLLVDEVLKESACDLQSIDAVAVCSGPGSYTGLRIGLATAKGFCYALDKPLILHNRLDLMLRELDARLGNRQANKLAILPARNGEYYVAAAGEYETAPRHISTPELLQNITGDKMLFAVIGNAENDLSALQTIYSAEHHLLDLLIWARAGWESFHQKMFADLAYATPEYLKAAYTTTPRADR
jgi:tRNA threonylcarbamoyladenosine biosynthesis protein TsaB